MPPKNAATPDAKPKRGRKPKAEADRRTPVNYRLDPETVRLLDDLAVALDLPKARVIDRAVEEFAAQMLKSKGGEKFQRQDS
jgi:hypothetical protein